MPPHRTRSSASSTPSATRIGTVVVGQDVVVERMLIALFTGGHLLLQGVPGLAKTLLVAVPGEDDRPRSSPASSSPSTCCPPTSSARKSSTSGRNEFRVNKGPIFTQPAAGRRDQPRRPEGAVRLLEAMQERKVTIGKETFKLPAPFLVIATQNPIEQSGTFELPEAQLDRFMLCHRLEVPDGRRGARDPAAQHGPRRRREGGGAVARTEFDVLDDEPVGSTEQLVAAMEAVQQVHVSDTFLEHVVDVGQPHAQPPGRGTGGQPAGRHRADQGGPRAGR